MSDKAIHYAKRTKQAGRFYTGVSLEPEVSDYLNDLSRRMGMSRSWVLNTIVHEYAHLMEAKSLRPLSSREAVIRL
jgi:hypothetical protein